MTFDPLAFQNPAADPAAPHNPGLCPHTTPYCPGCRKQAHEIPSVVDFARDCGLSPEAWVREEEGTYNAQNEHFLCDQCFIDEEFRRGSRLAGPNGQTWRCP